jgi:DNA-binding SARP family transcriptional activator
MYLTGNVALQHGDVLVPEHALPGPQGRLVFAVLATERRDAIAASRIADVLWPEEPPASPDTALRAIVSKLRGALAATGAECAIASAFGCYQLRLPPDAWVDVDAAAAAVHDAEAALRDGDLNAANGSALVAVSIARRPFLEGTERPWVDEQRARLRDICVRAMTVRAEVALRNGDTVAAAGDAERVIRLEPYREPGVRAAHARARRRRERRRGAGDVRSLAREARRRARHGSVGRYRSGVRRRAAGVTRRLTSR